MRRITSVLAVCLVSFGAWAVPIALALASRAAAAEPRAEPTGYRCDRSGAVTALAIRVDAPGTYSIGWDNRRLCGTAA